MQKALLQVKTKADPQVYSSVKKGIKTVMSSKSLLGYFRQISSDEKSNTKFEIPFYREVAELVSLSFDEFCPKIMKLFKVILSSIAKSNEMIQKRSMHFNLLFADVLKYCGFQFLEIFDDLVGALERANTDKEDLKSNSDIFVHSITMWLKQYTAKNGDSKRSARVVE